MFLKSDSVLRCPASLDWVRASRVPRRHQYYQSTTTSCAEYGVAYVFHFPAPTDPLLVRSHAAGEIRRAWSRSSPVPLATFRLVTHRSSQVPGESIPYLCPALGSRPVHRTSPYRSNNAAPTLRTVKALTSRICRDSITQLRYPLPTLQVVRYRTRMQGSLPAGGYLCREGVKPSGFHRKVSIRYIGLPPFPGLSWRYRKIPARNGSFSEDHPLDVAGEHITQEEFLVALKDDHDARQSSEYFLLLPRALSAGYFAALTLSFSEAARARSTSSLSASRTR